MKIDTNREKIKEILTRGVEDVFVKESLEKKLLSGKQLRIKLGIDPTGPKIHLGRATILRKLKAFQNLGHEIVLLVGDFTALIGDPSDKLEKRPMLTERDIKENLQDYLSHLGKIIDVKKCEIVYNSKWLSPLTFTEIAKLAESFTVQQMLARRNFKERLDKGQEISLRELLYPLMQGYDSVAVKADVEIGGFDQLFNVKAGRIIQKYYGMAEQDVLTVSMLEGTDGRKMSTSWGNVINVTDEPNDMFGKIMSLKDDLILKYFLLCTDILVEEIAKMEKEVKSGANPKDMKVKLAKEIVTLYHGLEHAEKAHQNFEKTFSSGGIPDDVMEVKVVKGELLVDILINQKIVKSKTEFRRLVDDGAVTDMGSTMKITEHDFKISNNAIYKVGKRRFVKVSVK